ncbi:MerR family transcriptional regulator [Levilactobacillus enshiensis]|uniref:MerR family transcriptional regulator n=1 Tax=Levilactobacillus enshiensis TaxID=2590213 RepID=UPI00131C748D|nr:MerR family transcriptional regulator [Levilactobacillus enshiensis]
MTEFTSGQLAKLSGVKKSTLRHYLDVGLITPTETTAAGYQLFNQRQLYQLYYIRFLRQLGYSLPMIHTLLKQANVTSELRELQQQVSQQVQHLQETQQTITEILALQRTEPLNTVLFHEQPARQLRSIGPEKATQLEVRNAQALGEQRRLQQLNPVIYFKKFGETTVTCQQTATAGEWHLPTGTYAFKQIAVTDDTDLTQAAQDFLRDPLLELASQPDLLIYENLVLSLVYSQDVIYTLEVRLQ